MELTHESEAGELVPMSPAFQDLWNWALSQGVTCPKLRYPVRFGAGYLGAQATARLEPSEAIVSVPRKLMLNIRYAEESEVAAVFQAHPEVYANSDLECEDIKIITYILGELKKGRDSFWYYLLTAMEKNVEVLCDWTREEMELLQDPELIRESEWKMDYIKTNWYQVEAVLQRYPALFAPEDLTFETFYWLWKSLSTRAFGKYNPSCSLVPLADLVNHAYCHSYYIIGDPDDSVGGAPDTCVLDTSYQDSEAFPPPPKFQDLLPVSKEALSIEEGKYEEMMAIAERIQAAIDKEEAEEVWGGPWDVDEEAEPVFSLRVGSKEAYEAGSQLFLFYGHYSNRQLLLHYGFAMEENMFNYARVCIPLHAMTSSASLVQRLQAAALSKAYYFRIQQYDLCTSLLLKVRALTWDPAVHSAEAYFYPRDLALEVASIDKTISLLQGELEKFPTTVQEDEHRKGTAESLRVHFAVSCSIGRVPLRTQESLIAPVLSAAFTSRRTQPCSNSWQNTSRGVRDTTGWRTLRSRRGVREKGAIQVPGSASPRLSSLFQFSPGSQDQLMSHLRPPQPSVQRVGLSPQHFQVAFQCEEQRAVVGLSLGEEGRVEVLQHVLYPSNAKTLVVVW